MHGQREHDAVMLKKYYVCIIVVYLEVLQNEKHMALSNSDSKNLLFCKTRVSENSAIVIVRFTFLFTFGYSVYIYQNI